MTPDRDFERIALAWLADGPEELSDRVMDAVVDEIHLTKQRHGLRLPRRFESMNTPARVAAAAVIGVLALGGALFAAKTPMDRRSAGRARVRRPGDRRLRRCQLARARARPASHSCKDRSRRGDVLDHAIRIRRLPRSSLGVCYDPARMHRGSRRRHDQDQLHRPGRVGTAAPAQSRSRLATAGIPQRSVDHLRARCVHCMPSHVAHEPPPEHPGRVRPSTTSPTPWWLIRNSMSPTPVDVELAGYSGKSMTLQVPDDISACSRLVLAVGTRVLRAGPSRQRWHLWILDVDGVRVLIRGMDFAATSAQHQAELRAIVESIQIEP